MRYIVPTSFFQQLNVIKEQYESERNSTDNPAKFIKEGRYSIAIHKAQGAQKEGNHLPLFEVTIMLQELLVAKIQEIYESGKGLSLDDFMLWDRNGSRSFPISFATFETLYQSIPDSDELYEKAQEKIVSMHKEVNLLLKKIKEDSDEEITEEHVEETVFRI